MTQIFCPEPLEKEELPSVGVKKIVLYAFFVLGVNVLGTLVEMLSRHLDI